MVWAAKPPGSLDLTSCLRSAVSKSTRDGTAAAEAAMTGVEVLDKERDLAEVKERAEAWGFWEIWEEKERKATDEAREDKEVAMAFCSSLFV